MVVDCTEGMCEETRTVVVKAALERTELVFCVTKVDALLQSSVSLTEALQALVTLVTEINVVVGVCSSAVQFSPVAGNVILCSALLGLVIDFEAIAGMFEEGYLQTLWRSEGGDYSEFCRTVLLPLQRVLPANFLQPLPTALIRLIVDHLPCPLTCARFRSEINMGELTPAVLRTAMQASDPAGPLLAFVSKKVYFSKKLFAVTRVFSGTLTKEAEVFLHRDNESRIGSKIGALIWSIAEVGTQCENVPAGNIALVEDRAEKLGVGMVVTDTAERPDFRYFSGLCIMTAQMTIQPSSPDHLPKLADSLRRLQGVFPSVRYAGLDFRQLWATDFQALQTAVDFLRKDTGVMISAGEPMPMYRETILTQSSQTCLTKSPNRHTRIYCNAEPLPESIVSVMESQPWSSGWKQKSCAVLTEAGGWNELANLTRGQSHFDEVADFLRSGFQYFCHGGVLCEESVRGMRVMLDDILLCADSIHRGGGQVIPTMRRCCFACQLTSTPALLEPIYKAEIIAPVQSYSDITVLLSARRAALLGYEELPCPSIRKVVAELCGADTVGLAESLEMMSGGLAFVKLSSSRWQVVPGDPLDPLSESGQLVLRLRAMKGLHPTVAQLSDCMDKL